MDVKIRNHYLLLTLILMLAIPMIGIADSEQQVKWKERDNQIIHSSVCYNHKYGSLKNRHCKKYAKRYFKKSCQKYTEKFSETSYPERLKYEKNKNKFCYSARNFRVI